MHTNKQKHGMIASNVTAGKIKTWKCAKQLIVILTAGLITGPAKDAFNVPGKIINFAPV